MATNQDSKIQKTEDICKDPNIPATELEKVIKTCKEELLKCLKEEAGCEIPTCTDGSFSSAYEKTLLEENKCECSGEILTQLAEVEISKMNILKSKDNQESTKLLLCYTEGIADTYDEINECLMAALNQDVVEMQVYVKALKEMDTALDKQVMSVAESIKKAKVKVDLTYKAICEFEICYKSICKSKEDNNIAKSLSKDFDKIIDTFNDLCRETDESLVTAVKIVGLNSFNSVEKLEGRINDVKNAADILKKDVETNATATKANQSQIQTEYIKATAEVRKNRYTYTRSIGIKRGAIAAFCYINGDLKIEIDKASPIKDDFSKTNEALDKALIEAKG